MTPRFLVDPGQLGPGATLPLPAEAAHHALRVLRLAEGDRVQLFDGAGRRAEGRISDVRRDRCSVRVAGEVAEAPPEAGPRITLLQGVAAADRMDWVVEKSVELGATRLVPAITRRGTVRLDADRAARRVAHWQRIVVAACMQCGRDRLPAVDTPAPLVQALAALAGHGDGVQRLLLSPDGERRFGETVEAARAGAAEPTDWILAIGPESGFDDDEVAAAVRAGFEPVRLGARTLRTETAGLAAIAALQALVGDY